MRMDVFHVCLERRPKSTTCSVPRQSEARAYCCPGFVNHPLCRRRRTRHELTLQLILPASAGIQQMQRYRSPNGTIRAYLPGRPRTMLAKLRRLDHAELDLGFDRDVRFAAPFAARQAADVARFAEPRASGRVERYPSANGPIPLMALGAHLEPPVQPTANATPALLSPAYQPAFVTARTAPFDYGSRLAAHPALSFGRLEGIFSGG